MKVEWKGVYPAVTTKFTKSDGLDLKLFAHNLEAQIAAGVDALVLGGTLGESSTLNEAEKKELVSCALAESAKRVPIVLNIAEGATKNGVHVAETAEKMGVDGLMLLPPMRYKASDEETIVYFKEIANATSLPIMIYNNPVDYKIEVTMEMFESLAEVPNIQAVKESTRDISNVTRMKNRFGNRFKILCGVDTLAMESLVMGADGWVAGLVCAFPAETVAIYKLINANRIEEARAIYRWFLPLLELDINPKLVQNIKLAEEIVGLGSEHVRAPRLQLAGSERSRVLKIINDALENRPALPDYHNLIIQ